MTHLHQVERETASDGSQLPALGGVELVDVERGANKQEQEITGRHAGNVEVACRVQLFCARYHYQNYPIAWNNAQTYAN